MSNKYIVGLLISAISLNFCFFNNVHADDLQKTGYSTEELNAISKAMIINDKESEPDHSAGGKIAGGIFFIVAGVSVWHWLLDQPYGLGLAPIYGAIGIGLVIIGAGWVAGGFMEAVIPEETLQRMRPEELLQLKGWVSSEFTGGQSIWGYVEVIRECDVHKEPDSSSEILARLPCGYRFHVEAEKSVQQDERGTTSLELLPLYILVQAMKGKKVEERKVEPSWYLVSFEIRKNND